MMCEHVHDSVYVNTHKAFRLLATGSLGLKQPVHSRVSSLQKQVGCFNHGVVTLVADKLETEVYFSVEDSLDKATQEVTAQFLL